MEANIYVIHKSKKNLGHSRGVLWTTWWWHTYKTETCSCILCSVAYYI